MDRVVYLTAHKGPDHASQAGHLPPPFQAHDPVGSLAGGRGVVRVTCPTGLSSRAALSASSRSRDTDRRSRIARSQPTRVAGGGNEPIDRTEPPPASTDGQGGRP
jgi:hypothetical protein